jgi:hypothetical protein
MCHLQTHLEEWYLHYAYDEQNGSINIFSKFGLLDKLPNISYILIEFTNVREKGAEIV